MIEIIEELLNINNAELGDLNEDGLLNILDIVLMTNMILADDNNYNQNADMNQDNGINILDIVILLSIILNY